MKPGLHHYGLIFHFVGKILEGRDAWMPVGPGHWSLDPERIDESRCFNVSTRCGCLSETFRSAQPRLQLGLDVLVPWVLAEAEPD